MLFCAIINFRSNFVDRIIHIFYYSEKIRTACFVSKNRLICECRVHQTIFVLSPLLFWSSRFSAGFHLTYFLWKNFFLFIGIMEIVLFLIVAQSYSFVNEKLVFHRDYCYIFIIPLNPFYIILHCTYHIWSVCLWYDNNVSNYRSGLNEKSIALEEIYTGCVLSVLAKVIMEINLK